jgi:nucleoid-associated protein YgaU
MKVQQQPKGRYYVVQDGDNLWKIATSQLGDGARFQEIAKLNTNILKSDDALSIGMRLRLPAN